MTPPPQYNSDTGFSVDYINQIASRVTLFMVPSLHYKLKELPPILTYTEYFNPEIYDQVRALSKDSRLKRLDDIVAEMNILIEPSDANRFNELYKEAHKIIYGDKRKTLN